MPPSKGAARCQRTHLVEGLCIVLTFGRALESDKELLPGASVRGGRGVGREERRLHCCMSVYLPSLALGDLTVVINQRDFVVAHEPVSVSASPSRLRRAASYILRHC